MDLDPADVSGHRRLRLFQRMALWICLAIYAVTYLGDVFGPPIRSDGAGYFAYLPSLVLHRDPSYETLAREQYGGAIPAWTGIVRYPATGRYVSTYNIGCAAMALPFYLVGHGITCLVGFPYDEQRAAFPYRLVFPPDGFGPFYQHAAGLAGVFYGVMGLMLLARLLTRYFDTATVSITLLLLFLGTNLLNYISGESFSSHAMLFFLYAAWLTVVIRWYDSPALWSRALLLGLVAGLLPLVRTPAAMVWIILPLFGLRDLAGARARGRLFWQHRIRLIAAALVAFAVFLPQMLMWHYGTGRWIANSYALLYPQYTLTHFGSPRWMDVLFSLRGGVLFWSPVLALAVAGFWHLRRSAPDLAWPIALVVVLHTYLIASWHDWAFGGGFGHRGFVELYALLAWPLAAACARVRRAPAMLRRAVWLLAAAAVAHVLFFMMLYYTRELSIYGLDRQALFDIFWWRYHALVN